MQRAVDRLKGTFGEGKMGAAPPAASASPGPPPGTAAWARPAAKGDEAGSNEAPGLRVDEKDLRDADTGKTAVEIAQQIQRLRQSEQVARAARNVQNRAGQQFINYRGVWVDQRFDGAEKLTKIKWGSEAFFRLAGDRADLREALSQGERVVVVTARGQAIAVDPDDGVEKLSDDEVKALFQDVAK
jgi:hypothetical protein